MRIFFYCIGVLAGIWGIALCIATAMSKYTPLTGYSGGGFVFLAGVLCFLAGRKNYRGHWSFVIGLVLCTIGFASIGAQIDLYASNRNTAEFGFALFLAVAFLTSGILSFWSGHKLHSCLSELERKRNEHEPNEVPEDTARKLADPQH